MANVSMFFCSPLFLRRVVVMFCDLFAVFFFLFPVASACVRYCFCGVILAAFVFRRHYCSVFFTVVNVITCAFFFTRSFLIHVFFLIVSAVSSGVFLVFSIVYALELQTMHFELKKTQIHT